MNLCGVLYIAGSQQQNCRIEIIRCFDSSKMGGNIDAIVEVKYFHFDLKHKGGVYYKYANTVLQALADDR